MATDPARRHLWQLPTFAAGLAASVAALAAFPPPPPDPSAAFTKAVAELKQALDKKPAAAADADRLRAELAPQADHFPEMQAKVRLLLGTADLLLAEQSPADRGRWVSAADHFAKADAGKLDEEDGRRLAHRTAKAAAALGTGDPKALAAALTNPPADEVMEGERLRLLGECLLRQTPPEPKRAAAALVQYLGGAVKLPAAETARVKLQLAEAFQAAGEPDKAKPWLAEVAKSDTAELQARARLSLANLLAADGDWAEAVVRYEEAVQARTLPADQLAAAKYQLGVGLTKTGKPTLAVPAFEAAAEAGGPAVVAARVRLAELALADPAGRGNRTAAVDRLDTLAKAVADAGGEFAHVTRPQIQAAFEQGIQVCQTEGDFAAAVRAAGLSAGVLPPGRDRQRRAEVLTAWAATLTGAEATGKLKQAAADTAALAGDVSRADRGQLLRQAADLYRKAGDAGAAVALTDQLTAAPGVPADVAAAAWLDKGEAQLAAGQFADAVESLKKAMAGSGPAAGVARVKLGLSHLQQAKAQAKTAPTEAATQFDLGLSLLGQAAGAAADSPAGREAHQQALFELGKVLLSRQNLPEAEARFRQLVQAYPGGPQSGAGQLYLGSVLLLTARGDGASGRPPADADAKLAEAAALFAGLADGPDDYLKREGGIRLVNAVLLQQKYDEVPGLCDRLSQPHRGKVQELIFLSMAYKAHEFAKRPEKAKETRVRMEELFARLGETDFPGGTAEYTRGYWETQWFEPLRKAGGRGAAVK